MRLPQIPHGRRLSPAEIDAAVAEQDRRRDAAVVEAVEAGKIIGKEAGRAVAIKAAAELMPPERIQQYVELVLATLAVDTSRFNLPGPVEALVFAAVKEALYAEIINVIGAVSTEAGSA